MAPVEPLYPQATSVGIAEGAQSNWDFLKQHTTVHILDFYHAAGYLAEAATALFPASAAKRTKWLETRCHELKHQRGAASRLLREMEAFSRPPLSEPLREKLQGAIAYFGNHKQPMNYPLYRAKHFPIGSGVTEAACKTLVKQRLCWSGMKWKEKGAGIVLSLRALVLTQAHWDQFWGKIDQYGFPVAAQLLH
jgi:hypothetical protein